MAIRLAKWVPQPVAVFLGSDGKPVRMRVLIRDYEVSDLWFVTSSARSVMSNGDLLFKEPLIELTDLGWLFRHINHVPILDIWGNVINPGLSINLSVSNNGELFFKEWDNKFLIRDQFGRRKWMTKEDFIVTAQRNGGRNVFCNLDYDNLCLSQNQVVYPLNMLSDDINLLAYQSMSMRYDFSASGDIMASPKDLIDERGVIYIPDNWIAMYALWAGSVAMSKCRSVIFPRQMFRLTFSLGKCACLSQLELPEVIHLPDVGDRSYIEVKECSSLETITLPAVRGTLKVVIANCANLASISMHSRDGFIARNVSIEVENCPHLKNIRVPDYYASSSLVMSNLHGVNVEMKQ